MGTFYKLNWTGQQYFTVLLRTEGDILPELLWTVKISKHGCSRLKFDSTKTPNIKGAYFQTCHNS